MTPTERDELNRKIAEDLEPFETLPDPHDRLAQRDDSAYSPREAWVAAADYKNGDKPTWYPRSFTGDPCGTALLMEKMIDDVGIPRTFEAIEKELSVFAETNFPYSHYLTDAVALAYRRIRGLA